MGRHKYILFVPLLLAVSSLVLAFSSGPPDGRTGAPSESTCQVGCHNSFSLNSGDGSFAINTPATYQSGDTIDVDLALEDDGQMRWGFEITALDAGNQPAGELLVVEMTRTQKSIPASGRHYIKHRTAGTNPGVPDMAPGWTLKWVANGGVSGPVTFYAAGNAANNASGNQGDFIYTASTTMEEQIPMSCCIGLTGNVDGDPTDMIDLGDLTSLIDFLFISFTPPECMAEANVDGDPSGLVDLGDLTALIDFLFISFTLPAECL